MQNEIPTGIVFLMLQTGMAALFRTKRRCSKGMHRLDEAYARPPRGAEKVTHPDPNNTARLLLRRRCEACEARCSKPLA